MQLIDYIIWTDGGCDPNPGKGGWGAVIIKPRCSSREEIFGGEDDTTNNRMEMQAVIEGLKRTPEGSRVLVCSDSKIVVSGGNGGGKMKANLDLWQVIREMTNVRCVEFKKVKGHSGAPFNERAHDLANRGMGKPLGRVFDQTFDLEKKYKDEGKARSGRWKDFGTFGPASEVHSVTITDEMRAKYEKS